MAIDTEIIPRGTGTAKFVDIQVFARLGILPCSFHFHLLREVALRAFEYRHISIAAL